MACGDRAGDGGLAAYGGDGCGPGEGGNDYEVEYDQWADSAKFSRIRPNAADGGGRGGADSRYGGGGSGGDIARDGSHGFGGRACYNGGGDYGAKGGYGYNGGGGDSRDGGAVTDVGYGGGGSPGYESRCGGDDFRRGGGCASKVYKYCGKTGHLVKVCSQGGGDDADSTTSVAGSAIDSKPLVANLQGVLSMKKLQKTRSKVLEFGKRLLHKVNGTSNHSDEETKTRNQMIHQPEASWKEVAERDHTHSCSVRKLRGEATVAIKPEERPIVSGQWNYGSFSRRSLERHFSTKDAVKLIEVSRTQLRKELENDFGNDKGWREVIPRDRKKRESEYARALVEGYRPLAETEKNCWKCFKKGHDGSCCPRGVICFNCKNTGHKKLACPKREDYVTATKWKIRNRRACGVDITYHHEESTMAPYKRIYKASDQKELSVRRLVKQLDASVEAMNAKAGRSSITTGKSLIVGNGVRDTKYIVGSSPGKGKLEGIYPKSEKNLGSSKGVAQPVCHNTFISEALLADKASVNGKFMEMQGPRDEEDASYAGSARQEGPIRRELRTTEMGEKTSKGEEGPATQESIYGKFSRNMLHDIRFLSYKLSKTSRNKMKQALLFGKTVLKRAKGSWKVREVGSDKDHERSGLSFNRKDQAWRDASESVDSRVFQEAQPVVRVMPSVKSERSKANAYDSYPSSSNPMVE